MNREKHTRCALFYWRPAFSLNNFWRWNEACWVATYMIICGHFLNKNYLNAKLTFRSLWMMLAMIWMMKVWWWWWWLWKRDVGGELGISDWLITKRQLDSLVIECHRQFVNSGAALADKRWWWWWWCQHILIHLGIDSCWMLKLWAVREGKGINKDNETGTYGLVSRGSNLVWKRAVDKGGLRKQTSSHVHLLEWFPKWLNEGFRGVFVLKSGLTILIRAPEVPFSVPPK